MVSHSNTPSRLWLPPTKRFSSAWSGTTKHVKFYVTFSCNFYIIPEQYNLVTIVLE